MVGGSDRIIPPHGSQRGILTKVVRQKDLQAILRTRGFVCRDDVTQMDEVLIHLMMPVFCQVVLILPVSPGGFVFFCMLQNFVV